MRAYPPRSFRVIPSWRRHLRGDGAVSLSKLLYCWRNGFYPEKAGLYDFSKHDPEAFFPDTVNGSPKEIDAAYASCSEDKVNFFLYMSAIGARTPTVLMENVEGRIIHYSGATGDLRDLLQAHGELVIKPRAGFGGNGVRIIQAGDNDPTLAPGEFVSTKVEQHAYAARIYPHSANTLRVLTAWDHDRSEFFVAAAVQRIGTSLSGRVDNWSAGGLCAGIDLATGRLGPATRKPNRDSRRTWWSVHPDTEEPIKGVEVPGFSTVCAELLAVCDRFPPRYIGWDIVITPDGWSIIEANSSPALTIFQVHSPLLTDVRLRRFFEREGVL